MKAPLRKMGMSIKPLRTHHLSVPRSKSLTSMEMGHWGGNVGGVGVGVAGRVHALMCVLRAGRHICMNQQG